MTHDPVLAQHPLDPLSTAELGDARRILLATKNLSEFWRFP